MKARHVSLGAAGLVVLGVMAGFAYAANASDPRVKEWETLCQQEQELGINQGCLNLRRRNGEFKGPDEIIEHTTEKYAPLIREVAKQYDVDPRAIVGAIMAEGSVNQSANYMAAKQMLVRTQQFFGVSKPGKIIGTNKYVSIGFGCLHADAAFAVEPLAARIEKRPMRSESEVTEMIDNQPEIAIRYIAAIFRDAIDQYAKYGIADKIKDHPDYLVTLYNIGKVNSLAAATAAEKRTPKTNFLGLWVKWNLPEIEKIAKANPDADQVVAGAVSASKAAAVSPVAAIQAAGGSSAKLRVADVVDKAVVLSSAPTQCTEGDKASVATSYQIIASRQRFPNVGTLNPGVPYKVLSPGIGCEFEDWVLVRAEDGATGWAPKKTVELAHKKAQVATKPCDPAQQTKCEAKLKESAKGNWLGKALSGRYFIRLQGQGKKLDWTKPDVQCEIESMQSMGGAKIPSVPIKPISEEEATQLSDALKKFKADTLAGIQKAWDDAEKQRFDAAQKAYDDEQKLVAAGKTNPTLSMPYQQTRTISWDDDVNPYSRMFNWGGMTNNGKTKSFTELEKCIRKDAQTPPEKACLANVKALMDAFSKPLPPQPSFTELKATMTRFTTIAPTGVDNSALNTPGAQASAASALDKKRKELLGKLADCNKLIKEPGYKFSGLETFMSSVANAGANAQLWNNMGNVEPLGEHCQMFLKVIHNEDMSQVSTSSCRVVTTMPGGGSYSSTVAVNVFKALLHTKEDMQEEMDVFLDAQGGKWLFQSNSGSGNSKDGDPANCKYNPLKTAEWIENLLKDGCVARVYVPDPWLVEKLENYGSRVLMGQMPEPDRMMAEIGGLDCQENTQ